MPEVQLLLDFTRYPDPGYDFAQVWDAESRTFIEVQTMVFTGPRAVISIVPDRPERTSPIYDVMSVRGMSTTHSEPQACRCGCGLLTTAMKNGNYRTYVLGHNKHKHWRGTIL